MSVASFFWQDGRAVRMERATDPVTRALTRAALSRCLGAAIQDAGRTGGSCSVFLFDVDYFKSINDTYGHVRGDEVLSQIAERVAGLVRATDVLVRYGGDEFVLVLPRTGRLDALPVAMRMVDGLRSAPLPGTPPLSVSVSLGTATFPDDAANAEDLLAVADRRNYLAKDRGRGLAVGDDLVIAGPSDSGRVLERDSALAAAHDFLVRLAGEGRGAACVTGPPGMGHTRFLSEVSGLAELRGFVVIRADDVPKTVPARVLVVADTDADWAVVTAALRDLVPATLGLLYAVHDPAEYQPPQQLPLLATIALSPLSPSALRVWLRLNLRGEPSPALVEWVSRRSRGVPARARRELTRLVESGSLDGADGHWDISASVGGRDVPALRRLPFALSTLIGRRQEINALVARVRAAEGRLITLVGAGGIGKTRLSVAVADALAEEYAQGTAFVPLAEATTPELVASALADLLEISEVPGEPLTDTVVKHLADRHLLLVLDNLEQVLSAAPFVADMLAAASGVTVLATSRQRLGLPGEQVYQVPPLPLPELGPNTDVAAATATSAALALFVTRAREAAYDLVFTPQDVAAAARICHLLDGLPLAIELAAARCDKLTPVELLDRLSVWTSRLDLLTDGPYDLPARQQTLRSTIDWSFALLDPEDSELATRFAVFAGGATVEAVTAVCTPGGDAGRTAERLAVLADKSLLGRDGERYRMLETVRSYADERLAASPAEAGTRQRHAEYFAEFAEQVGNDLRGSATGELHARVAREYPNLRAAMEWGLTRGEPATAGRIMIGLKRHWDAGWQIGDGWQWYHRILAEPGRLPDRIHVALLQGAAFHGARIGDHVAARRWGEESLRIARQLADPRLVALGLQQIGTAAMTAGDYGSARGYYRDCLALQAEHDPPGQAATYVNLSSIALRQGELEAAEEAGRLGLELAYAFDEPSIAAVALANLAEVAIDRGDPAAARTLLAESLALGRQVGDVAFEAFAGHRLGLAEWRAGNRPEAYRRIAAALEIHHRIGRRSGVVSALDDLCGLLAAADPVRAARLGAAAQAQRERYALPIALRENGRREEAYAVLRSTLTKAELTDAGTAGRGAPLDDVVAEALAVDPESLTLPAH